MKKLTGWITIILLSIFLVYYIPALFSSIYETFTTPIKSLNSVLWIVIVFLLYFIIGYLLLRGFKFGLKRVKDKKLTEPITYDKTLEINVSGRIPYIKYRNVIMGLSLRRPVFLFLIAWLLFNSLFILYDGWSSTSEVSKFILYFLIVLFFVLPLSTLIQINRIYNSNKLFQETLYYKITNEAIHIEGDTIESKQKWTHFYKIRETKHFFMLFQGKMVATFLEKSMFSASDLQEFQLFIQSLEVEKILLSNTVGLKISSSSQS